MTHGIYRVTAFRILGPYTLQVSFDDGLSRTIDFEPVIHGELFGPLRDLALFESVKIDPEVHTLVWPNGTDFDPESLHRLAGGRRGTRDDGATLDCCERRPEGLGNRSPPSN